MQTHSAAIACVQHDVCPPSPAHQCSCLSWSHGTLTMMHSLMLWRCRDYSVGPQNAPSSRKLDATVCTVGSLVCCAFSKCRRDSWCGSRRPADAPTASAPALLCAPWIVSRGPLRSGIAANSWAFLVAWWELLARVFCRDAVFAERPLRATRQILAAGGIAGTAFRTGAAPSATVNRLFTMTGWRKQENYTQVLSLKCNFV